jgi:splicing factor 3B subunit 4
VYGGQEYAQQGYAQQGQYPGYEGYQEQGGAPPPPPPPIRMGFNQ